MTGHDCQVNYDVVMHGAIYLHRVIMSFASTGCSLWQARSRCQFTFQSIRLDVIADHPQNLPCHELTAASLVGG
jgi:hypothetical protein